MILQIFQGFSSYHLRYFNCRSNIFCILYIDYIETTAKIMQNAKQRYLSLILGYPSSIFHLLPVFGEIDRVLTRQHLFEKGRPVCGQVCPMSEKAPVFSG